MSQHEAVHVFFEYFMDTRYELWQTGGNGGYRMLVGTYDTWDEAFGEAKKRSEECNDEGNYWAEMYGEVDYFILVEEGLTPHKLKRALKYAGNIDFKDRKWVGKEKQWRKLWKR